MDITGRCHCGNIGFLLTMPVERAEIPARVCGCTFCVKHGGVWTSSPAGTLRIRIAEPADVNRYQFGTRTAHFHVCRVCGVVPFVTSEIEGRTYAVVNVNALENVPATLLKRVPASFDGEGEGDRLARRARYWLPDVSYVER